MVPLTRICAPPLAQTEAEWKETERLLEDFKQLGPIWVEMEIAGYNSPRQCQAKMFAFRVRLIRQGYQT